MSTHEAQIRIKGAYQAAARSDGTRVLVDRLWPRGVRKADAAIDRGLKEIAPSPELRMWFGHDPDRFGEFGRRYREELADNAGEVARLEELGILKTHIDVYVTNSLANAYWRRRGWQKRDDVYRYSYNRSQNPNV